jgi:alpha-tubulin suppressor-like RCC1 family protein
MAYVKSNNRLYTFGLGGNGQLGLGSKANRLVPTPVPPLPSPASKTTSDVSVISIFAGGDQCLVLAAQSCAQVCDNTSVLLWDAT